MRRFAVVTVLTVALALAALATGGRAEALASVADAGDSTARSSATPAPSATAANGGGVYSNVERYQMPVRRTRRAATALACAVVFALLLIAFAIWKKVRSRARGLT